MVVIVSNVGTYPHITAHQIIILWMKAQKKSICTGRCCIVLSVQQKKTDLVVIKQSFQPKVIQGAAKLDSKLGVVEVP